MGSLYKQPESKFWYLRYDRGGKRYRESSRTTNREKAQKLLDLRTAQAKTDTLPDRRLERITLDELAADLLRNYRLSKKKTLANAERTVKRLLDFFGPVRVVTLTTSRIQEYMEHRRAEGRNDGTINRELVILRRMFTLGATHEPPKVARVPSIAKLKEGPPRRGFFEEADYKALRAALPDDLKPVVALAYHCGFRRGEIFSLTWEQVDLEQRRLVLEAGTTKNDEGRVVYMTDDLYRVLDAWWRVRMEKAPAYPFVCFRIEGGRPVPIQDFR